MSNLKQNTDLSDEKSAFPSTAEMGLKVDVGLGHDGHPQLGGVNKMKLYSHKARLGFLDPHQKLCSNVEQSS